MMAYYHIATGKYANTTPAATTIEFPPWGASHTTGADSQLTIRAIGVGIQIEGFEGAPHAPANAPYIGVADPTGANPSPVAAPFTLKNGESFVIVYQQNNCSVRVTMPPATEIEFVEQFN
jgi:hypothetical protein